MWSQHVCIFLLICMFGTEVEFKMILHEIRDAGTTYCCLNQEPMQGASNS